MSKFRVCEKCGANLDPGEVCDCEKEKEKENERAMQEAIQEEVTFHLEKKAGSERFHRQIQYSSGSAAVNGVAVLIRELASMMNVSTVKILSILAVVLTAQTIQGDGNHE